MHFIFKKNFIDAQIERTYWKYRSGMILPRLIVVKLLDIRDKQKSCGDLSRRAYGI